MPESSARPQPNNSSQFSLRSLFALTFCLAVGLACGVAPSALYEGWESVLGLLYEILFASASAAVCIGLLQQAIFLSRAPAFGRQFFFAIGWRITIAALLILCLSVEIFVLRGYMTLPAWQGIGYMDYGVTSPRLIQYACLLVVLGEYRYRLLPDSQNTPVSFWRFASFLGAGVLLLLLILPTQSILFALVYFGMGEIELDQPLLFQRLGTYPCHRAEGHKFFWLSFAATTCLILGVTIWLWLLCHWKKNSSFRRLTIVLAVACLSFSSWYGIWYYTQGLAKISPEFFEVGFQSHWPDWVGAGGLLALFVTVGAVRIARKEAESLSLPIESDQYRPAFHETWFLWLVFSTTVAINVTDFVLDLITPPTWLFGLLVSARANIALEAVYDIGSYLPLAISLLSLQILWLRWKNRFEPRPLSLTLIDWRKFGVAWLSLALMLVIGVPVISAFCLSFWLGPWYLL